jgi:hypothetical protein
VEVCPEPRETIDSALPGRERAICQWRDVAAERELHPEDPTYIRVCMYRKHHDVRDAKWRRWESNPRPQSRGKHASTYNLGIDEVGVQETVVTNAGCARIPDLLLGRELLDGRRPKGLIQDHPSRTALAVAACGSELAPSPRPAFGNRRRKTCCCGPPVTASFGRWTRSENA